MTEQPKRGNTAMIERNWSIWRDYHRKRMMQKELAQVHDITNERVRGLLLKYERRIRKALTGTMRLSDEMREATLGVEFVFTHELLVDDWEPDARPGWSKTRRKGGEWRRLETFERWEKPTYQDTDILYRVEEEDKS